MLKAVITSRSDMSASVITELGQNQVIVCVLELCDSETAESWLERAVARMSEQGVDKNEGLVISSDGVLLRALVKAGVKCIGYLEQDDTDADLFGCCEYVTEGWEGVDYRYINRVFNRLEGSPLLICRTEHLIIRELVPEDVPHLCRICSQRSVREFISDIGEDLQEETEKHLAYIARAYRFYDYGYWGVYDKQTGELIGRCGIQDNEIDGTAEAELGYLLAEEVRGRGYAKEAVSAVLAYAFHELRIPRIVAVIDKKNTASLHVAESCGMLWEKDIMKCDVRVGIGRSCSVYVISSDLSD